MNKHIHQLYYTLIILSSIISFKTSNNHTNRLSYRNTTNISAKNIITNHCRNIWIVTWGTARLCVPTTGYYCTKQKIYTS